MKIKILILCVVLLLVVAGVALANGSLELPRWVIGSGASYSTAGDVSVQATLGQPIVGVVSGGNTFLGQGYWHGSSGNNIYLPLVQR